MKFTILLFSLATFGLVAGAPRVAAQPEAKASSTLQEIRRRGAVVCGASVPAPGFAVTDRAGNWSGFDVDFCRALAVAVLDDPQKFKVEPLEHKQRLTALHSGDVDVLLSGAPWTQAREAGHQLLYGAITFYGGQGLLARRAAGVGGEFWRAAGGAPPRVCVQQGGSSELILAEFYRQRRLAYSPVSFASLEEAARAYDAGACNLLSADVVQLHEWRSRLQKPEDHVVLTQLLSKSPVGPIVRQGDDQWFNVVRWTHFAMVDAEEFDVGAKTVDTALSSDDPDLRRLVGSDGDFGEGLGLRPDWAYRVIREVGNYAEVFERNLGMSSPFAMERRQNALWTKGGLMYAPPVR
jgi:general L-amino acid transport system substrate-binding protein